VNQMLKCNSNADAKSKKYKSPAACSVPGSNGLNSCSENSNG